MQTNQATAREDIEAAIEQCEENIYEYQHALRWFTRGIRIFLLGIAVAGTAFTTFAILYPLNIPILQPTLLGLGITSAIITAITGIVILFISFNEYGHIEEDLVDNLDNLREAKRLLAKGHRRLALWDEQALKHLTAEQYMYQLPSLIASYRKRADRYRNWFVITQVTTIFLSAGITSLSGGWLDRYLSIPWIIPVVGAAISILTSFTLFFKLREKGTNLQQTADAMDWEHMACTLGIERYKGMDVGKAQVLLAEQAEALRKEQQKKQLQLEQSSHAEQKALQSTV